MPRTAYEVLRARIALIDALIELIDRADGGERGPCGRPLQLWQELQPALEELRALPVCRQRLAAIQADVSAVEQAVRAWSTCGYQPTYGLGRRLLLRARGELYELLASAPLRARRPRLTHDLAA